MAHNLEFDQNEEIEDLLILDFIENGIPRQVNERKNHFDVMDEASFRKRFRLSRRSVLNTLALIEGQLEFPYDTNNCVSPINQLLVTLRYYSTGGHLQSVADFSGMHVSTVSRIIKRVSDCIAGLYQQFIHFGENNDAMRQRQQNFYDVASFPRVVGAIDCTHVKIQSPGGDDAEIYRNRKGYFSINTQMICDSNLKILNVVARWPGSSHDSTIFSNSTIRQQFEDLVYPNCLLLGDSGYPIKNYLFTPLLHPTTDAEQLYNQSHIRTRNVIERCFGVLKRRFPVLAYGCRVKIETLLNIIVAGAVLHNIALSVGEQQPPPIPEELDNHVLNQLIENGQIPPINNDGGENLGAGAALRRHLINVYFSNL